MDIKIETWRRRKQCTIDFKKVNPNAIGLCLTCRMHDPQYQKFNLHKLIWKPGHINVNEFILRQDKKYKESLMLPLSKAQINYFFFLPVA